MDGLGTTNVMLLVLAVTSVVQTAVIVALAFALRRAYDTATRTAEEKLTPALLRLERVLMNLEQTTAVVRSRTEDVNRAMSDVQHTVGAVLGSRAAAAAGVAGGLLGVVRRWRNTRRARRDVTVVSG